MKKFRKMIASILCISMILSMNIWAYADADGEATTDTSTETTAEADADTPTDDEGSDTGDNGAGVGDPDDTTEPSGEGDGNQSGSDGTNEDGTDEGPDGDTDGDDGVDDTTNSNGEGDGSGEGDNSEDDTKDDAITPDGDNSDPSDQTPPTEGDNQEGDDQTDNTDENQGTDESGNIENKNPADDSESTETGESTGSGTDNSGQPGSDTNPEVMPGQDGNEVTPGQSDTTGEATPPGTGSENEPSEEPTDPANPEQPTDPTEPVAPEVTPTIPATPLVPATPITPVPELPQTDILQNALLGVAPITQEVENVVGRTGTIKARTTVYSSIGTTGMSMNTWYEHKIIIEGVTTDDNNVVWYRYSCDDSLFDALSNFPWVKAANVTLDPVEEPIIPNLDDMTAESIYTTLWQTATPSDKQYILEYLQANDNTKYDELNAQRFPALTEEDRAVIVTFANIVETLPETEILAYFQADQELYNAWSAINADSTETPDEQQAAFDAAENTLATTMSTDTVGLQDTLNEALWNMVIAYEDANTMLANGVEASLGANSTILATYNALMPYIESPMQTFAANNEAETVGNALNDIVMHLFDYGTFINGSDATGDADDKTDVAVSGNFVLKFSNGQTNADNSTGAVTGGDYVPIMADSLVDGFPKVTGWYDNKNGLNNKDGGSLKYLFDPDNGFVQGSGTADSYTYGETTSYQSVHLPVDHVNLFKETKIGDSTYYLYDSAENAAYYDYVSKTLSGHDFALRPYQCAARFAGQGHFLPFNNPSASDKVVQLRNDNNQVVTPSTFKGTALPTDESLSGYELSRNVHPLSALHSGEYQRTNMWYGMTMEFDFTMPESGQLNGTDMIFDFQGDDDVFVYIDDKLVLNIGGTHGATRGNINFATGAANVYAMDKDGSDEDEKAAEADRCTTLQKIFDDPNTTENEYTTLFATNTVHTLKFFYLERGGDSANCRIQFNIVPLPPGDFAVSKYEAELNNMYQGKELYNFQLCTENGESISGAAYSITGAIVEGQQTKGTVGNDGKFSLYGGQTATFSNITTGTSIFVKELINDGEKRYSVSNDEPKSKDEQDTTKTFVIDANEKQTVTFTNTWNTADLTLTKEIANNVTDETGAFEFTVTIDNNPYTGAVTSTNNTTADTFTGEGKISLMQDETITIADIPIGTAYSISETKPVNTTDILFTYRYREPLYKVNNGDANEWKFDTATTHLTILENDNTVTVTNRCIADLKITKDGADEEIDPNQTFIFNVTGNDGFTMDIVVRGKGEAIIKDLPLGTYTVTEDIKWSWRYTPDENNKTITLKADKINDDNTVNIVNIVKVNNTREKIYWIDGNTWCQNIFSTDKLQGREDHPGTDKDETFNPSTTFLAIKPEDDPEPETSSDSEESAA